MKYIFCQQFQELQLFQGHIYSEVFRMKYDIINNFEQKHEISAIVLTLIHDLKEQTRTLHL